MKKAIVILAVLSAATIGAFAQGAIDFNNISGGGVNAPVANTDGTTLLAGGGFSAQLYAAVLGTPDAGLTARGSVYNFLSGGFAGYMDTASGSIITISGVAQGSQARVQMRAWNNAGGTITSWESATIRGESTSFNSLALGDAFNPATIPDMTGLTSFSLSVVPEPSTVVLGVMGGLALLLRRRK